MSRLLKELMSGPQRPSQQLLPLMHEIREALDAGYSRRQIWRHLRDAQRFTGTYRTFLLGLKRALERGALIPATAPATTGPSDITDPPRFVPPATTPTKESLV